jgi:enamine deaminase RidA (YjgF/YER057c/UK114 family)
MDRIAPKPYAALAELDLTLPALAAPGGNYCAAKTVGNMVFLAGVISQDVDGVIAGTVGVDRTVEEAYVGAKRCVLQHLAVLEQHLGSLERVKSVVSVNGYVNSVPGFAQSPKCINGASDLLVAVFGEAGIHVRAAIGVSGLPLNALVELQMVVEI